MTIQVLLSAATVSFGLGLLMGVGSCQRLKMALVSPLIEGISFVLRGIPFFVQLLIVYFVLPDLLGFNLDAFPASIIALGSCSAGYVAQFIRTALNAVPLSQWEAAFALGYTTRRALWCLILPQTLRQIVPLFNNELDAMLKSTAVISSIGLLELTRAGMNIVSREMEPVPIYLTLALFYLGLSLLLNLVTKKMEKKFAYVIR